MRGTNMNSNPAAQPTRRGQLANGRGTPVGLSLKPRHAAALAYIGATISQRGSSPSLREIREHLGLPEDMQAYRVVEKLIRMRLIARVGAPIPRSHFPSLVLIKQVRA